MTGSNLNMVRRFLLDLRVVQADLTATRALQVPLQVVGSDLDGTTGPGTIDFTCPQVTPNAE